MTANEFISALESIVGFLPWTATVTDVWLDDDWKPRFRLRLDVPDQGIPQYFDDTSQFESWLEQEAPC